jgi:elongation factor Ts
MAVTTDMIKELRRTTSAGVLDCKKALEQCGGDPEKAAAYLREKGLVAAAKKAERAAVEGRVDAYIHPGNQVGVLIEVNCETDFVARTARFEALCHDLAMQVAAMSARWVARADVPTDVVGPLLEAYRAEAVDGKKPAAIVERILQGKIDKFYAENCLLEQLFIKDDSKTIQQLVNEAIATIGENIVIARFARFSVAR